jgi:hypothetical protein
MFNQFKSNNLKSEPKLFYETIKNSLEYYDDYRFKNIKKQEKISTYKINKDNNTVKLYDKNNILLYNGKFQVITTIYYPLNLIKWSYENPYYTNNSYYSSQILNYILSMDIKYNDLREYLLFNEITQSTYTKTKEELSTNIKISIIYYLLKKPNFFYVKTELNNNEYYDYICLTDKVNF